MSLLSGKAGTKGAVVGLLLRGCLHWKLVSHPHWQGSHSGHLKQNLSSWYVIASSPPFPTADPAPHLIFCSLIKSSTVTVFAVFLEDALEQTVDRRDVATEDRGSTEEKQIKGQSNEQIYGKVASFLEQFKSLESAKEQLNCLEEDLKIKKETLEAAISKVEAAWKVSKSDG